MLEHVMLMVSEEDRQAIADLVAFLEEASDRPRCLTVTDAIVTIAKAQIHMVTFLKSRGMIGAREGFAEHVSALQEIIKIGDELELG
jgi:hypothetical protein